MFGYAVCLDPDWSKCILPDDLAFDAWVEFVFDHPILEPRWWWQTPQSGLYQFWNDEARPALTLSHLTTFFRSPGAVVERYSRSQIDQGLNYLFSNACSSHMFSLTNSTLPWTDRLACFEAIVPLYAELMSPVYRNDLGHLDRTHRDPTRPNYSCYMWWDDTPIHSNMDHPDRERIHDAVLAVFERVLTLKSEACCESVLHGLGHWHSDLPERTKPMVRRFLQRTDISAELRAYAELAAVGGVQ